jgi:hypothetical protein
MQAGYVDPANLLFARDRVDHVRDVAPAAVTALRSLDDLCAEVYRDHPFHPAPDLVPALRRLVESPDFRSATELG